MSDVDTGLVEGELPAAAAHRKPFAAFVQEHRAGGLHAELSEALGELVAASREHDKPGSLTLVVKVQPNKDGLTVTVTDEVKLKAPEPERGAALYFADGRGNLSRRNPMQPELPLREAGHVDRPVRDHPDTAKEASA